MKQVGNTILAKGVNHILAKRDNSAWPKGSKLSGFSTIYKSGILNEYETQRYIKLPNGYNVDVYSLPLIITLSFRLNTLGAYKMREYIIIKLTSNPRTDIVFMNVRTHECMNESKWEHN